MTRKVSLDTFSPNRDFVPDLWTSILHRLPYVREPPRCTAHNTPAPPAAIRRSTIAIDIAAMPGGGRQHGRVGSETERSCSLPPFTRVVTGERLRPFRVI